MFNENNLWHNSPHYIENLRTECIEFDYRNRQLIIKSIPPGTKKLVLTDCYNVKIIPHETQSTLREIEFRCYNFKLSNYGNLDFSMMNNLEVRTNTLPIPKFKYTKVYLKYPQWETTMLYKLLYPYLYDKAVPKRLNIHTTFLEIILNIGQNLDDSFFENSIFESLIIRGAITIIPKLPDMVRAITIDSSFEENVTRTEDNSVEFYNIPRALFEITIQKWLYTDKMSRKIDAARLSSFIETTKDENVLVKDIKEYFLFQLNHFSEAYHPGQKKNKIIERKYVTSKSIVSQKNVQKIFDLIDNRLNPRGTLVDAKNMPTKIIPSRSQVMNNEILRRTIGQYVGTMNGTGRGTRRGKVTKRKKGRARGTFSNELFLF